MARRMHLDIETEAAVDVLMGESFDRQQPGLSDDERCSSSGPLLELHAYPIPKHISVRRSFLCSFSGI